MNIKEAPGIKPEIVAAICAGIMAMEAEKAAVSGKVKAVRIRKTGGAWLIAGRQKVMDSRF